MKSDDVQINFQAPANLRKWPSLNNERRATGSGPYMVVYGTLEECIREFMSKSASTHHLDEIHCTPQPPLVTEVLSQEHVVELARLREFLWSGFYWSSLRKGCDKSPLWYKGAPIVKKATKKRVKQREWTKDDIKELKAHSKARTPVVKIAKTTKRTVGALRQKALHLGIGLGHQG
jgi:hypothetical protein